MPVRLLSDVDKLFERVIAGRIIRHLYRNGPDLSVGQFGFREEESTIDAIKQVQLPLGAADHGGRKGVGHI